MTKREIIFLIISFLFYGNLLLANEKVNDNFFQHKIIQLNTQIAQLAYLSSTSSNNTTTLTNSPFGTEQSKVSIATSMTEICNNGIDDDGDGLIDCADPDCQTTTTVDPTPCNSVALTSAEGASIAGSGTSGICLFCSVSGESNLIDANTSNNATISIPVGVFGSGYIDVNLGTVYPAGTRAGFVADVNGGIAGLFNGVTLTTYLNGSQQQSISGGSLINILGIWGDRNIAAIFCQPFDRIRITTGSLAGVLASYRVFHAFAITDCLYPTACGLPTVTEICDDGIDNDGDGLVDGEDSECASATVCNYEICDNGIDDDGDGLIDCADPDCQTTTTADPAPCNSIAMTSAEGASVGGSGTSGICLFCSVNGESNVIDANTSNNATISIPIGVFGSGYIDVNLGTVYPAGTRAGFVADVNGGIAGLFNGVTLTTYLNGSQQQSISGGSLINILGIWGDRNIAATFCQPFDRIRITTGSLAGVLASYRVFHAFAIADCQYPTACGSPTTTEICNDGIDNDGDGLVDGEDSECTTITVCNNEICDNGIDDDGDGLVDGFDDDCFNCASGTTNLAIGRFTSQSSTNSDGRSSRAVDGNTSGIWGNNSVTHTNNQAQAWWQVDLGAVEQIQSIVLWNRTDCCSNRLSDFHVFVSDVPFTSTDLNTTINQSGVWSVYTSNYPNPSVALAPNRTGRYVRVQLANTNVLSLAEVQVIGCVTPVPSCDNGTPLEGVDSDGDGWDNACDLDDDNDGILDCVEKGLYNTSFNDLFDMAGSARQMSANEIQLTPSSDGKAGSAFTYDRIDFNQDFNFTIDAYLGNNNSGADGIALVFHNDPKGSKAVGLSGMGIGARNIQNGIVLELDTYDNGSGAGVGDIGSDHGMIWNSENQGSSGHLTSSIPLAELEDGAWHTVTFNWDAANQTIQYEVDGQIAGIFTGDLINTYFGGSNLVHFGFTASTGAQNNDQRIRFTSGFCDFPAFVDTDNDGIENYLDLDSDGDGCSDANEYYVDLDADGGDDGVYGAGTPTVNNDGLVNGASYTGTYSYANSEQTIVCIDTDNDGIINLIDLDDDNDGITDCEEKGLLNTSFSDFFDIAGHANQITPNEIQLTPNATGRAGSAFTYERIDFTQDFNFSIDAYLGNNDSGADGVAIVFHNDPAGSNAVGQSGLGIGARNIQNGIVLELDTYDNGSGDGVGDISNDHGLIWDSENQGGSGLLTNAIPLSNLEDGAWHTISMNWNATSKTISYQIDGVTAGVFTSDLINTYFGGSNLVHFGFTASTGSRTNDQRIRFTGGFCDFPAFVDSDNDGIENYLDLDSDEDGCSDANEYYNTPTADGGDDGVYGVGTPSVDSLGLVIAADYTGTYYTAVNAAFANACLDSDMDGVPDYIDLDDDNDGVTDVAEGFVACSEQNANGFNEDLLQAGYHATLIQTESDWIIAGEGLNGSGGNQLSFAYMSDLYSYPGGQMPIKVALGGVANIVALFPNGDIYYAGDRSNSDIGYVLHSSNVTAGESWAKTNLSLPAGVSPTDVKIMRASGHVLLIVTHSGVLYVVGQSVSGQLDPSFSNTSFNRVDMPIWTKVIDAKAARNSLLIFGSDSQFYRYGDLTYDGDGSSASVIRNTADLMIQPFLNGNMVQFALGNNGAILVLDESGLVHTLGENSVGQLGIGNTSDQTTWTAIPNVTGVKYITSSVNCKSSNSDGFGSGYIGADDKVYLFGYNSENMLTNASSENSSRSTPMLATGVNENAIALIIGGHITPYISADKGIYNTGHNLGGGFGDGTTTDRNEYSGASIPDILTDANFELCQSQNIDTDEDGIPNHLDLDSDEDGCSDANEYYNSSDADGGDDGVYGMGTPAVDSLGKVIAASYTGDYTNAQDHFTKTACPTCNAGTISPILSDTTISNICPANTANLDSITASNTPFGAILTWHTGTPATDGNRVADSTAVGAGTFYATFYDTTNICYTNSGNATTEITVTIKDCTDTDNDGVPDVDDLDDDNDGVTDVVEDSFGGGDSDGDGIANRIDLDADEDGCSDANEYYNNSSADGGDGGEYGTGVPEVDEDGLVVAASYTGNYTNADNNSISDICCGFGPIIPVMIRN